jgi:hypothetical protein
LRKTEVNQGRLSIDWVGYACQCPSTERHLVGAAIGIAQSIEIAPEHSDVGEKVLRQENWLRSLQVGVARHWRVKVPAGNIPQGVCKVKYAERKSKERTLGPQAEVSRYLIVARTAGVQPTRDRTNNFPQPAFNPGVDIFVGDRQMQLSRVRFRKYLPEASFELDRIIRGDDALCAQHASVGD